MFLQHFKVGKNSVIKAEFFMTIRVVPDLDIFPDSPAATHYIQSDKALCHTAPSGILKHGAVPAM